MLIIRFIKLVLKMGVDFQLFAMRSLIVATWCWTWNSDWVLLIILQLPLVIKNHPPELLLCQRRRLPLLCNVICNFWYFKSVIDCSASSIRACNISPAVQGGVIIALNTVSVGNMMSISTTQTLTLTRTLLPIYTFAALNPTWLAYRWRY
mgnify:CR=1 FL=1